MAANKVTAAHTLGPSRQGTTWSRQSGNSAARFLSAMSPSNSCGVDMVVEAKASETRFGTNSRRLCTSSNCSGFSASAISPLLRPILPQIATFSPARHLRTDSVTGGRSGSPVASGQPLPPQPISTYLERNETYDGDRITLHTLSSSRDEGLDSARLRALM